MCNKMSDVRLSDASPAVERVDARQPDAARPPVRRNLFGTPDPEEIQRCVAASIEEGVQSFTQTYNFDPVSETPLSPGNYEWQQVTDPADYYRRPPHGRQPPRRGVDLPGDNGHQEPAESGHSRGGSRKRPGADSGPRSGGRHSKRSHTDEGGDDDDDGGGGDDDDEQSGAAGSQAAQETLSAADNSAQEPQ